MAQERQARLSIYFDATKITTATSITITTDGGKTAVYTLDGGLVGFSLGPGQVSGSIDYALAAKGQEYPFQQKACRDETVVVQIVCGAEHYAGSGQIMTDEKSQSVNNPTSGTCTFTCEKQEVQ